MLGKVQVDMQRPGGKKQPPAHYPTPTDYGPPSLDAPDRALTLFPRCCASVLPIAVQTTLPVCLLLSACTTRFDAPGPEPDTDPNPAWAEVLTEAVTEDGVDYVYLQEHREVMDDFLSWVAVHGPNADDMRESIEDERIPIMANAYNASVLRAVMHHEVQESVREVGGGLWSLRPGAGFFLGQKFRVNGEYQSLYFLEQQDLIGRYQEPLVHVTLNCASRGCPPLRYWEDKKIIPQMRTHLRSWLATDDAMRLDPDGEGYQLNEIFYWYERDFTDWSDAVTVCDYLVEFAKGAKRDWLSAHAEDCPRNPIPYDWSLDASKTPWPRPDAATEG
jgi:hypothetical protein